MPKLYFGGSFNPIHHGHLICARAVAEMARFENVVLIPCGQPPHKSGVTDIEPASHRLAMCQAAIANDPFFELDRLEIDRSGPSYTIDTVRHLRQRASPIINWLIGADMALSLPSWHQSLALLTEVKFILMARPSWSLDWTTVLPPYRFLAQNIVPAPLIDISSSDIRNRLATGRSIDYLTPPAVVDYIKTHRLYRA